MKRALVTGAAGFVGRWLCAALAKNDWAVTGVVQYDPDIARGKAEGPWGSLRDVQWRAGDIRNSLFLESLATELQPDAVLHLAAVSHVPQANQEPTLAWDVNLLSTVRLLHELNTCRAAGVIDPIVLLIGSAEQYGRQPETAMPLKEDAPQEPLTAYGATKAAQELAGMQNFRSTGLKTIGVRPFPHSGPGQESRFLIPALLARAVAHRDEHRNSPMIVGNVTPVRDYLHVSDVVAAYISLLEKGLPGVAYNVASGVGLSVQEVANRVLARVGANAELVQDPTLVREIDVPTLVGDATRLTTDTGWRPARRFDDILDDLLDYHRRHAATH
ncbi:MAG: GDP-mannose 4,6-dehydratase [Gemmatimonadota bacterium]|nr:GDP-mannose 4,6-dehydratase [Gemmatimonadota bacterium]